MEELKQRRLKLCQSLDHGLIVLGSRSDAQFEDTETLSKQDPNMIYYTGMPELDSTMILENLESGPVYHMFVPPKDPTKEVWTGKRLGVQGALSTLGADHAYDNINVGITMLQLFEKHKDNTLYHHIPNKTSIEAGLVELYKSKFKANMSPIEAIHKQRVIKSPSEIETIRKACNMSANTHNMLMSHTKPDMFEYELDGKFIGRMMEQGCRYMAYPCIAANGNNATTLHYCDNSDKLKDGDLVLVDAGGEYKWYASDITRTWPVNGKFSEPQREIYNIVLSTQLACIDATKPGVTIKDIQELSFKCITEGLIKIGLLQGSLEENLLNNSCRKYYMHGVSHFMGMEVHDCETVNRKTTPLEPGMVLTIEPGIYISEDLVDVDPKYLGIGVRIEDDVLVTESGCDVLSEAAVKAVSDVEKLINTARQNPLCTLNDMYQKN